MQELYLYSTHTKLSKEIVESNCLSDIIIKTATCLIQRGCSLSYTSRQVRSLLKFGDWLNSNRIPLHRVTTSHIDAFLKNMFPSPPPQNKEYRYLKRAACFTVRFLLEQYPPSKSPVENEVERYAEHLRSNRGLNEHTIQHHCRHLRKFLAMFFKRKISVWRLSPTKIRDYFDSLSQETKNVRHASSCTLRSYFRFLQIQGWKVDRLLENVPSHQFSRRVLSPKIVSSNDLKTLLRSVDKSTEIGKRTYATILCLSDLGMRVGDIPRITLDDFNWRDGTIVIRNNKSGSPIHLPMSKRLGKAFVDYISKGRPPSESRRVFLCCSSYPIGKPVSVRGIWHEINKQWEVAELHEQYSGTHVIRHSTATNLKRKGVPLKVIADIMGHQSMYSTSLYVQVDVHALRQVAQPWPIK